MTAVRAVFRMSTLAAAIENRFPVGQWLLLSDYGELARRNMVVSCKRLENGSLSIRRS